MGNIHPSENMLKREPKMNSNHKVYKIRDSIDLYLSDNDYLTIYYVNTRKRKKFKISEPTVFILENIDGKKNEHEIFEVLCSKYNGINICEFEMIMQMMEKANIIVEINDEHILSKDILDRFNRQINYFGEFFSDEKKAEEAMNKIIDSKILIIGCGAVGGDIAIELVMAGVGALVLFDSDRVEEADVSRHLFFDKNTVGRYKADVLSEYIRAVNSNCNVTVIKDYLYPEYDLEPIIVECSFIVNTADEPYIGYTASKVSRICIKHNIPHFIGGGFDAHLASTGEIIIPHVTPCVECYAQHFKKSLKNWKPKNHPVKKRYTEIGGLSAMSLFSASFSVIEILKCICNLTDINQSFKTRGELLTEKMDLSFVELERDEHCEVCGKNE